MIQRFYEITCDYCRAAIEHGVNSKERTIQTALKFGMFMKNKHHFCSKDCYDNWLNNNKNNILGVQNDRT